MTDIVFGKLEDGSQLSFPLSALLEKHWSIEGSTGQRKTLFMLSILMQFLRAGSPLVIIDLGGDRAAYWILREACRLARKLLHLFSLNASHNSLWFDPLVTGTGFSDTLIAANAVASGLNLIYSEGYGRSFWGRFNLADVNEAFDRLGARGIVRPTFRDFVHELKQIAKERRRRGDISEAVLAADQLSRVHHFGVAANPARQLNIAQIIENREVAYFWLPTALYGASARAVATLASWCTMVEMAQRDELGLPSRSTHLAIDEYAQIAAGKNSLEAQLVLSRKWGLQMWLVFQSREQMKTTDGDLAPVLRDNTQRFLFTVDGEEQQRDLMYCSEDEVVQGRSVTQGGGLGQTSIQLRDELRPKLSRNKIIEVSGAAMKLFGVFKLGDKHRDPVAFQIIPPTATPAEHAALKAKLLPAKPSPTAAVITPAQAIHPERIARHAALLSLFNRLRDERQIGNGGGNATP